MQNFMSEWCAYFVDEESKYITVVEVPLSDSVSDLCLISIY